MFRGGTGCEKCRREKISASSTLTTKEFIEKAQKIHRNKYDYSLVNYVKTNEKVTIKCNVCGKIFEQTPNSHLSGKGCIDCGYKSMIMQHNLTTQSWIERARKVHRNKYDYSLVEYVNSDVKVKIICPKHGVFEQRPDNHLLGYDCPKCKQKFSKREKRVLAFIKNIYKNTIIENARLLNNFEIDIFIPLLKLGFEFDGLYYHSQKFKTDKLYHVKKKNLYESKGIQIYNLYEDECVSKYKIIKSKIKHILGLSRKIHGRKTSITEIDYENYYGFVSEYGIFNENKKPTKMFALLFENRIICVQGFYFSKQKWTMGNYVVFPGLTIVGGMSKILKHFQNITNAKEIFAISDRRWDDGKSFKHLGFTKLKDTEPLPYYLQGCKRTKILENVDTVSKENIIWNCGYRIYHKFFYHQKAGNKWD